MAPLSGIKKWFGQRITKKSGSWSDMLAGFSLASMNIPQVLGYARIAEMPAVCGLYTVLFPLVAFALFGSCSGFCYGRHFFQWFVRNSFSWQR